MLPDSTVKDPKKSKKKRKSTDDGGDEIDGVPLRKVKKKSDTSMSRKKPLKKKMKKKVEVEDYGSDLELDKELHPISHYIKDRRQLVRQMFTSLKKPKLKSMLPEILKKYSPKEIEEMCCDQIEIMSKKRIMALIIGRRPDEISSSGTDDNSSDDDDAIVIIEKVQLDPPDSTGVTIELPTIEEEIEKVKPHTIAVAMGTHDKPINKQKLEILELEMRARAIKKMLQSQLAEPLSDGELEEPECPAEIHDTEPVVTNLVDSDQPCTSSATRYHYVVESISSDGGDAGDDGDHSSVCEIEQFSDNVTEVTFVKASGSVLRKKKTSTSSEIEPGELVDDETELNNSSAEVFDDNTVEATLTLDLTNRVPPGSAADGSDNHEQEVADIVDPCDIKTVSNITNAVHIAESEESIPLQTGPDKINCDLDQQTLDDVVGQPNPQEADKETVVCTIQSSSESCSDLQGEGQDQSDTLQVTNNLNTTDCPKEDQKISCGKASLMDKDNIGIAELPSPSSKDTISSSVTNTEPSESSSINFLTEAPEKSLKSANSSSHQDIFEAVVENSDGEMLGNDGKPNLPMSSISIDASLSTVDDTNSALYQDVPSPGKYQCLPQIETRSDSNSKNSMAEDQQTNALNILEKGSSEHETVAAKDFAGLNWSADLEVNLEPLEEELVESEIEEIKGGNSVELFIVKKAETETDFLEDISGTRAPTPEITAQRYRSRDFSSMVIREMADSGDQPHSPVKKKPNEEIQREHNSPKEIKTKVYSCASNVQAKKSSKSNKSSKAKSKKSGKIKVVGKTTSKTDECEIIIKSKVPQKSSIKCYTSSHSKGNSSSNKHATSSVKCDTSQYKKVEASSSKTIKDKAKTSIDPLRTDNQVDSASFVKAHSSQKQAVDHPQKTNVFDRLSMEHKKKSNRLKTSEKYTESHKSPQRKHMRRTRSRSPQKRSHAKQKSSSPKYRSNSSYKFQSDDGNECRDDKHRNDISHQDSRRSRYNSQDDRSLTTHKQYRQSSESHDKHVSPKRFRAGRSPALQVITLKDTSRKVPTYDQVPSRRSTKTIGTKRKPATSIDDESKSPVRFPSPDIEVLRTQNIGSSKHKPLLVVLSDSE